MKGEEKQRRSFISTLQRRAAYILSLLTFLCIAVSFVTPYWLQSWPRIHTAFRRLGLWEFCMNGYIQRKDDLMRSYFGCWWIFAPYYDNVRAYLLPPWFRTVQVLMSLCFIIELVKNIIFTVYHCKCLRNVERRAYLSKALFYCTLVTGVFLTISSIIFGVRHQDLYWMPTPTLNWPSWSYGFSVLAGFWAFMSCPLLWNISQEDRWEVTYAEHDFPMQGIPSRHGHGDRTVDEAAASTLI